MMMKIHTPEQWYSIFGKCPTLLVDDQGRIWAADQYFHPLSSEPSGLIDCKNNKIYGPDYSRADAAPIAWMETRNDETRIHAFREGGSGAPMLYIIGNRIYTPDQYLTSGMGGDSVGYVEAEHRTSVGANRGWNGGESIRAGGTVTPVLCGVPGGTGEFVDGWGFGPVAAHAYEMYAEGDQRRDGGIYNHLETVGGDYGFNVNNGRWQSTGYFNRKIIARINGNHDCLGDGNLAHCNNYRVYRYAETLLNAAELAVLLGQDGSSWLQQVRDRAGASYQGTDRDSILEERRREFLGEGKRYWDLVRSGKAAEVLTSSNHLYRPNDWSENKKYWPIPQSEIDKDPNLVQNNY